MSLGPGTRLGPYEIQAAIGAGGMGEVYRAFDSRLGRDVAIKVLPATLSADGERLQRFEQEARAAAALSHPNILAVHDIGQHEGTPYIVSELLEGETLRERLKGGALPLRKAVEYAVQVCHGLAAAHDKGIVHRDLKPENIFLTSDGHVKILDFGLAKLTQPEPAFTGVSALPTTPPHTLPGVVLGTIGYMSPEQVRGLAADHRSDIFAFGATLHEMLSGQRAFRGDTVMDTMMAIAKEDPPDLPATERHLPPALVRIVDRCLEKSPAARFKSADDLAFALEALSTQSGAAEGVVSRATPRRREGLAWMVAGLLAAALTATLALSYVRTPAVAPEMRVEVTTPATSDSFSFAISPDAQQLVFVSAGDGQPRLWLRPLDATTAQPLAGTEGASLPFWSPDSKSVGFFDGSKLKRIDIGAGRPQTLADAVPRGGTWNTDGIILFAQSTSGPLFSVPASGGQAIAVTRLDALIHQRSHRFPQFLPGGRRFLFYAQGTAESQGVYLASLDSTETKRLTPADAAGVYMPPNWLLFVRQGAPVARHVDLSRGELVGDLTTVAASVGLDGNSNAAALSVSAMGLLAYRTGAVGRRQLTWFDRSGKALGTLGAPDEYGLSAPRLAPDGRRAAVYRTVQGNTDIWLLDGVRTTRFTFDPSLDDFPIWSADGNWIVFDSTRKGPRNLYRKPSNGTGNEEVLLESPQDNVANDSSMDGRFLLYSVINDPTTGRDGWMLPLTGDRKPFAWMNASFDERPGEFSPDGRWVAYTSNESGQLEIYVRPFPKSDGQWLVSTAGGVWPRWRPDGKELYYIAPDGKLMAAPIAVNGTTLDPGAPVALFQTRIVGGFTNPDLGRQYDVAPDGRFLVNVATDEATASPITIILNWVGLKQ